MGDHDRPAHAETDDVDRLRGVRKDHLVVEDQLLHEAGPPATVLLGPRDADVARLEELFLPGAPAFDEFFLPFRHRAAIAWLVGLQPGPDLVAKLLFAVA